MWISQSFLIEWTFDRAVNVRVIGEHQRVLLDELLDEVRGQPEIEGAVVCNCVGRDDNENEADRKDTLHERPPCTNYPGDSHTGSPSVNASRLLGVADQEHSVALKVGGTTAGWPGFGAQEPERGRRTDRSRHLG